MTFYKLKISLFAKSDFSKHVYTLLLGTAIAQVIPVLASPLLTRLYPPAAFGEYEIFLRLAAIPAVVACGRYEPAIMLPSEKKDAFGLLMLSLGICVGLFALLLLTAFVLSQYKITFLELNKLTATAVWLLPVYVLIAGINQAYMVWTNKKQQYPLQSKAKVVQGLVLVVITLFLGYFYANSLGLIWGMVAGIFTADILMILLNLKQDKHLWIGFKIADIKSLALKYQDFPKINALHALFDSFQASILFLLIAYYFGDHKLGLYAFGIRIIQTPVGLISRSVSQVYFQRASEAYHSGGDAYSLTKNIVKKSFVAGLPVALILGIFSSSIFAVLFGEKWRDAGLYVQILSPWLLLSSVVAVISHIPIIVNKQKLSFLLSILYNLIFIVSIIVGGYYMKDINFALYVISIAQSVYFMFELWWFLKIIKKGNAQT